MTENLSASFATSDRVSAVEPVVPARAADADDHLMRAYAQGDAGAFETLYARHRAPLYRFVRRLLGRAGESQVEEVFQDTWLRVVHARAQWQARGATFRTWLFTIAHHRAVDTLRRRGRERGIDLDLSRLTGASEEPWSPTRPPWEDWPDAAQPQAEDVAFWRAAGQRLLDCLDALPTAQRAAFLLHHEDGFGLQAIAEALQIGAETAKSRLRYAMSKLRTCMGAYLPGADVNGVPASRRESASGDGALREDPA